jgi:hypothetical protein
MKDFLAKLSSRKFLTCVSGVILGVFMIFGLDTNAINTIAGAITSIASVVTYICTEGKVDAAAVKDAVDKLTDAAEVVDKIEE